MINSSTENLITEAVNRYSDTVFRVAFQYTRNRYDAEDILQEVFLQLLKTPTVTDGGDGLKAWLIRVTINKSKDFLRARKRRHTVAYTYDPPVPPEGRGEVFEALALLSEGDRNALYLHYYEGYTAREAASILGGTERAMTKRIGRARDKLKKFLEE